MIQSLKQLHYLLKTMGYMHSNEDCSEVAQRVKDAIGRGKIITIVATLNNGQFTEFKTSKKQDMWVYHTVVLITLNMVSYIIDLDQEDKYQLANRYLVSVQAMNAANIHVLKGDVGGRIRIGAFSQNLSGVKLLERQKIT